MKIYRPKQKAQPGPNVSAVQWCRDMRLPVTPHEKLVLVMLASRTSSGSDIAYPSVARLARDCGDVSERTVQRNINALQKRGLLRRVAMTRVSDGGAGQNAYCLMWRQFLPEAIRSEPRIVDDRSIADLVGYDAVEIAPGLRIMHEKFLELVQAVASANGAIGPLESIPDATSDACFVTPPVTQLCHPPGDTSVTPPGDTDVTPKKKSKSRSEVSMGETPSAQSPGDEVKSVRGGSEVVSESENDDDDGFASAFSRLDHQCGMDAEPEPPEIERGDAVAGKSPPSRGTGSRKKSKAAPRASEKPSREELFSDQFLEFWAAYPRKDEKGRAAAAFLDLSDTDKAAAVTGAVAYAAKLRERNRGREAKFQELGLRAQSWLQSFGWTDFDEPAKSEDRVTNNPPAPASNFDNVDYWRDEINNGFKRDRLRFMASERVQKILADEEEQRWRKARDGKPMVTTTNIDEVLAGLPKRIGAHAEKTAETPAPLASGSDVLRRSRSLATRMTPTPSPQQDLKAILRRGQRGVEPTP